MQMSFAFPSRTLILLQIAMNFRSLKCNRRKRDTPHNHARRAC